LKFVILIFTNGFYVWNFVTGKFENQIRTPFLLGENKRARAQQALAGVPLASNLASKSILNFN